MSVDVGIVFGEVLSGWIVCYVDQLLVVVAQVADTVLVGARVADLSRGLLADGEGVATFYVLDGFGSWLIHGGRQQNVDMVGHDYKAVEEKFALIAIAEERGDGEGGIP